jgi:dipeptidyl aminopeptidase/acylaminoacyl peptidase
MRKLVIVFIPLFVLIGAALGYVIDKTLFTESPKQLATLASHQKDATYDGYSFKELRSRKFAASRFEIGEKLKDEDAFSSYMFYFFVKDLNGDTDKKVSGVMNIPKQGEGAYPVIVMFRGYVDREIYTPGEGTRRTGEEFASNGFITLAPDFLGYGKSDMPSVKPLEERFQTYTTALTLLSSLDNLNSALRATGTGLELEADIERTAIWGHSNGGHIALAVLEITGRRYPTVLWAPVSKPFPYSILYFTDEFDDHGKALRKIVADFEKDYDIEEYSPSNFYTWINAPIQVHQGLRDEAVPVAWSKALVNDLEELEKDIEYFEYSGENHNFNLGSWQTAVTRSVNFYSHYFKE